MDFKTKSNESRIVSGRDLINTFFIKAVNDTSRYWDVIVPAKGATLFHYMIDLKIAYKEALKRGVRIRAITELTNDNIFYIKQGLEYFSEVRHLNNVLGTSIVSEKFYITTSTMYYDEGTITFDNGVKKTQYPLEQLLTSTSTELTAQQKKYFEILWSQAMPINDKINQLETLESSQLRTINAPYEVQNLFINLLQSVQKEIYLLIPTFEILEKVQQFLNIFSFLESYQERIQAKILMPITGTTQLEYFKKFDFKINDHGTSAEKNNIEIRDNQNFESDHLKEESNSMIAIFDRNKSITIRFITEKTKKNSLISLSEILESATYFSGKETVLSSMRLFDKLWYQTKLVQSVEGSINLQKEFVNLAAHELQNPIQPILSLSEVMIEKLEDEEQRKLLRLIIKNATNMMHITNGILEIARIEKNILKLHKEKFDLVIFLADLMDDYEYILQENNNRLEIVLEFEACNKSLTLSKNNLNIAKDNITEFTQYSEIIADRVRLTQILHNLIDNANNFTKNGIIRIRARTMLKEVEIQVVDNGSGISKSILNNLFDKFVSTSKNGTGLGLYVSKKLVEAHGGRLWAKNIGINDTCASFTFILPNL